MRRSVRLALLVSWDFHIPLFSQIYEGNQNDSVTFSGVSVYHLGPTASAEDSGSSRTKMVFRYQAASWRLLVGARARFRVASRRYSPTEGPCFRLGAWASMVRTKSSCWARSQRAAVAPKSRSSAHRGRPGAWERSWSSFSAVPRWRRRRRNCSSFFPRLLRHLGTAEKLLQLLSQAPGQKLEQFLGGTQMA